MFRLTEIDSCKLFPSSIFNGFDGIRANDPITVKEQYPLLTERPVFSCPPSKGKRFLDGSGLNEVISVKRFFLEYCGQKYCVWSLSRQWTFRKYMGFNSHIFREILYPWVCVREVMSEIVTPRCLILQKRHTRRTFSGAEPPRKAPATAFPRRSKHESLNLAARSRQH